MASVSSDRRECNAYVGDTPCSEERPILCLRDDGVPRPAYPVDGRAKGELESDVRFWVRINDQPANCWN